MEDFIMRKLSIIGLAISMTFILSACSGQVQAETNPTTAMVTTVSETTTEAETTEATTISETTVADMGNYGEYGKEASELLKLNWVNGIYENEAELRAQAPIILGSISEENLEIIIQELLSLDRPNSTSQETTQSESLIVPTSVEPTKAPQPTQAPQPETTQAVEPETKQAEPQQTTPAETQSQVNNSTDSVMSQEEFDKILEEAGLSQDPEKAANSLTISDGISVDPEDNQGWNWH